MHPEYNYESKRENALRRYKEKKETEKERQKELYKEWNEDVKIGGEREIKRNMNNQRYIEK